MPGRHCCTRTAALQRGSTMARLCMMQRVRDGCAYFLQHFTPHACPLAKRVTTLTCSRCRRWQVRAPGGVLLLPVYGHLGGRTTGFVRHASSCLRRPRTVAAHGPRYEGCCVASAQSAESAPSLDAGYTQPGWAIRSWQHNRGATEGAKGGRVTTDVAGVVGATLLNPPPLVIHEKGATPPIVRGDAAL